MVALERGCTTQKEIDAFLGANGVTPKTVIELGSFEIIKKFVEIGLGIAIMPERAARTGADGIRLVHFAKSAPHIELGAVYRKDRFLPHTARAFLDLAVGHFKNGKH
jgi:DNA-binding transcriptional LysR family regulator